MMVWEFFVLKFNKLMQLSIFFNIKLIIGNYVKSGRQDLFAVWAAIAAIVDRGTLEKYCR